MGISFFKLPKHKVFNYQPIFYDERKEAMKERFRKLELEEMQKKGTKTYDSNNLRGKFKRRTDIRKSSGKTNPLITRTIAFIALILIFVILYYVARTFGYLLK